ncbi:Alpha-fetoprotein, partial [Microtus ochrogaster]
QRKKGQSHCIFNTQILCSSAIIMVAQFLQDAAYVKVQTIAEELLDRAEKCKSFRPHESPAECAHQLRGTFLTHICNDQGLMGNQVFSDCCKMEITARLQCFLSSKKDDTDSIDVPLIPRPELTCETDEGTHMSLKTSLTRQEEGQGSGKVAVPLLIALAGSHETHRHPVRNTKQGRKAALSFPLMDVSAAWIVALRTCRGTFLTHICNGQGLMGNQVFSDCCKMEITARLQCFLSSKKDDTDSIDVPLIPRPELICETDEGTHMSLKTRELILLTKKQPKANFSEIAKLTTDIKNLHEICCEGNTVACALGRHQLMNYTCSHQAILSSKFAQCCEQPEPFRGECIINSENDDKPNLTSLALRKFTEDQSACKQFSDKQEDFLQDECRCRLGTVAGHHSRFGSHVLEDASLASYQAAGSQSPSLVTRFYGKARVPTSFRFDKFVTEALKRVYMMKEMFQRVVHEGRDRVKTYCDLHRTLGGSNFKDRSWWHSRGRWQQLPAASRCCPLSDELQSACVEDALILGALCRRHDAKHVSAGVGRCCNDAYAFRKPCFDDLRVDGAYIPPPLSCDQIISLKEDLCRVQEDELQTEKQKLLSNLVKQRPQAAEGAFQAVGTEFTELVAMCCHAEERVPCFQEEWSSAGLASEAEDRKSWQGTPTDQEVPVPLRGRLIPESDDVGSPTWKITVDQGISRRPSVGAERWPVHIIFPFPLTNGILTPRPAPQNSTITSFASQEQWQRRNSKSTPSLQPI